MIAPVRPQTLSHCAGFTENGITTRAEEGAKHLVEAHPLSENYRAVRKKCIR